MGKTTTPCCYNKGFKKGAWSCEEDEIFVNYVNKHGIGNGNGNNWHSLSKNAGLQRCGKSCRQRWFTYLSPDIKHGSFTLEEKKLVTELHATLGNRWSAIATKLPGRTSTEIRNVWNTQLEKRPAVTMDLDPQTHEPSSVPHESSCDEQCLKRWSFEEDDILVNYINQHGPCNWGSLPKKAGLQRCGLSCRYRWFNYLRPEVKRGSFTPEEEKLVMELQATLGNRWPIIATQLPGRTETDISNLWNTHLQKRLLTTNLDPQTHEPSSAPHGPSITPPTSSTHQIDHWESVGLEVEGLLSSASQIYKPHSSSSDYFLQLWTSEVGDSFRKVKINEIPDNSTTCQSLTSPSKCHMAQWESARLEAESRLSSRSQIYKPHSSSSDFFLRLWNSEVGESFRKVKINENPENSRGLVSLASSSTSCASNYGLMINTCQASMPNQDEDIELKEDSRSLNFSCSNPSKSALQLILDLPSSDALW